MIFLGDEIAKKLKPFENINILWCFIVLGISSEIPSILIGNLIGYSIYFIVIVCLLRKYFQKRNINIKYIFGDFYFPVKYTVGFFNIVNINSNFIQNSINLYFLLYKSR